MVTIPTTIRRDAMLRRCTILLLLLAFCAAPASAAADNTPGNSQSASKPLTITVSENGNLTLQTEQLTKETLVARLHAITQGKLNTPIVFHVKRDVSYGRVIEAMGLVSADGYSDVKLEPAPR